MQTHQHLSTHRLRSCLEVLNDFFGRFFRSIIYYIEVLKLGTI